TPLGGFSGRPAPCRDTAALTRAPARLDWRPVSARAPAARRQQRHTEQSAGGSPPRHGWECTTDHTGSAPVARGSVRARVPRARRSKRSPVFRIEAGSTRAATRTLAGGHARASGQGSDIPEEEEEE